MSARELHKVKGTAWSNSNELPAFLDYKVDSIDSNPDYSKSGVDVHDKVLAWELDSVSQRLSQLWQRQYLPPYEYLENIALEDANFTGVKFSGVDLSGSVLLDACFQNAKLDGTDLTNTVLRHVELSGADLSNIKNFAGSTWKDTDWWSAKSIPSELQTYLAEHYPRNARSPLPNTSCAN